MARSYVEWDPDENGRRRWRVFSTVVNTYVSKPMTMDDLIARRLEPAMERVINDTLSLLTSDPKLDVMGRDEADRRSHGM